MQTNSQPVEKKHYQPDQLEVHSIFYTIQGEGPFCGTPAVFVRLAGCNLQCPMCDTDYTSRRTSMYIEEIVQIVREAPIMYQGRDTTAHTEINFSYHRGLVVITGGEPFRQDLDKLCERLIAIGCYVQIETNGTLPVTVSTSRISSIVSRGRYHKAWNAVYIVCSPKTGSIHSSVEALACCFKYVMNCENVSPDDGLPTHALHHFLNGLKHLARPKERADRPIYLQPMDEQNPRLNSMHLQACINSCMTHGYILQLQIHKILRME